MGFGPRLEQTRWDESVVRDQRRGAAPKATAAEGAGDLLRLPAGDGRPECLAFVPATFPRGGRARVALCVHGISRDFEEQIELLRGEASRRGYALLAPLFDAKGWRDYQRLGRRGRGPRADLALDRALECLENRIELELSDRFLIGYSGGAQFVHRYAMAHPNRVQAVVCAAAGWYTMPDPARRYPHGLKVDGGLAGVRLDPAEFLRIPVLTVVGDSDVELESMRASDRLDRVQGRTRIERAQRWSEAMDRAREKRGIDSRSEFILLEGAGHAFSDCVDVGLARRAFEFFDRQGQRLGEGEVNR